MSYKILGRIGLKRIARDDRGSAAVEFAFVVPILITLLLGAFDYGRYVLLHQKVARTATTIADLTAQEATTVATLPPIMDAATHILTPFETGANSTVIVTEIEGDVNDLPQIIWQGSGAGSLSATSQFGSAGLATLPAGLTVQDGEILIVAEVFFTPSGFIYDNLNHGNPIYHRAIYRPRYGF